MLGGARQRAGLCDGRGSVVGGATQRAGLCDGKCCVVGGADPVYNQTPSLQSSALAVTSSALFLPPSVGKLAKAPRRGGRR